MGEKGTVQIQQLKNILEKLNRVAENMQGLIHESEASPSAEDVLKKTIITDGLSKLCKRINKAVDEGVDVDAELIGQPDDFKSMCAALQPTDVEYVTRLLKKGLRDCTEVSSVRFENKGFDISLVVKEYYVRIHSEMCDNTIQVWLSIETKIWSDDDDL